MLRYKEEPFDYKKPLFVRQPFMASGRLYKRGDAFKDKNVTRIRLRRLFKTKYLTHTDINQQELGKVKIEKEAAPDTAPIIHTGGGWYEYKGKKYQGKVAALEAAKNDS